VPRLILKLTYRVSSLRNRMIVRYSRDWNGVGIEWTNHVPRQKCAVSLESPCERFMSVIDKLTAYRSRRVCAASYFSFLPMSFTSKSGGHSSTKVSLQGNHPTDKLLEHLPQDTRVCNVRLLVSPTNVLVGPAMRTFLNAVEGAFTGRPSYRTVESMWTHFAVELEFDGGAVAILERTANGVAFKQRSLWDKEYGSWSGTSVHVITMGDVMRFYRKENARKYSLIGQNCKHFAYNFFAEVFHQGLIGDFGNWCRPFEDAWKQQAHW
jgi:hypothetical protein